MISISNQASIGDILTSLSIFVSVIILFSAWQRERKTHIRKQADRIRNSAAETLAKLERWQELVLWYYEVIQPLFVEVGEVAYKEKNIAISRDYLWKQLNIYRTRVRERILDEQIETAYVKLYAYHPAVYSIFQETIAQLEQDDLDIFNFFLEDTQDTLINNPFILSDDILSGAELGDKLRDLDGAYKKYFSSRSDLTIKPLKTFLVAIINGSDRSVLSRRDPLTTTQLSKMPPIDRDLIIEIHKDEEVEDLTSPPLEVGDIYCTSCHHKIKVSRQKLMDVVAKQRYIACPICNATRTVSIVTRNGLEPIDQLYS